ncbi:MAG: TonB-dependent receptor [Candidatus Kapabacteria bacterium]|nr:TonB-dependent receptor [Ignavibacteriota bacterium]MCW5883520.1 TonB-dependent receptor [Candidatus Kapabacteria bacterium]
MKSKVYALGLLLMLVLFSTSFSQSNGEITGQIIDEETGEPLRRATVTVIGTKLGGFSDVKGDFKIKNLPEGKYNIKISFVGYLPRELADVIVVQGKATSIGKIVLGLEKKTTEEVYVEARRINDNESAILAVRKNAAQVSDGISQQEMSRLPDSDAGQSLKRVSGVTLVDNKFVFVRGSSERYSNTTLNGASLSSTEPDKKAFAFDMFPSEFLQNVNIAKSFTPDLPGNFAGGLVQLNTVDFPDGHSFKVSYSNSYNTNTTLKGNKFLQTAGGATDWLGWDDGTRALPSSVPSTRRELDALRTAALNPADQTGARDRYEGMLQSFNNNIWQQNPSTVGALSNSSIGLNYSDLFTLFGNEFGILSSVNWGQTFGINDIQRNALMADGSTFFRSNGTQATRSVSMGGLVNMAYKFGTSSSISFRNVYNRSADDETVSLHGQDSAYQFIDYRNFSTQYVEKEIFSTQLGGEHALSFGNMLIEWNTGYSYANRYEPDFRKVRYDRQLYDLEFDPNTPYFIQLLQTEQGDGGRVGRFFSDMIDNTFSGKIDFTLPLTSSIKLKFGTLAEFKDRDFGARSLTVIPPPTGQWLNPDIEALMNDYENPQLLFASENFRVEDGLRIGEETKLSDSYKADEELVAGYLMLDVPFELGSESLRFIGGVRYEDSRQIMNTFDVNDELVNTVNHFQDFLPSLNLMWRLNDKSNIRASATQTLSRPSLRELAPFAFYDFVNTILVFGNPNLQRTLIQNYDLRYEIFPNPGEVISVSAFYKNFENAIEETIQPLQSELGKSFANAEGSAINYGVELELRKSFSFISNALRHFALNVNLSLINSEITVKQGNAVDTRSMWGQSPYSLNLGIFYLNPETQTSINLAYNTYGRRIMQVALVGMYDFEDPHIYEMPRDIIDLSISQPVFNNKMDLKLIVRDLLNQHLIWEQGGRTFASNLRGTTIGLSLGYRLN